MPGPPAWTRPGPLTVDPQLHARAGRRARERRCGVHIDAAVVGRVHQRDVTQLEAGLSPGGALETVDPATRIVLAQQGEAQARPGPAAPQLHQCTGRRAQGRWLCPELGHRQRLYGEMRVTLVARGVLGRTRDLGRG